MNLRRWLMPWRKATDQNTVTPIRDVLRMSSPFGWITESFGGAWQRNLVLETNEGMLAFAAVFACVSLISGDIAKIRLKVLRRDLQAGIWEETDNSPFVAVLRKPNRYQTRLQFIQQWMISKLLWGNTYVLKERDARGLVRAMYILDPTKVTPLIAPDGEVLYRLGADRLAGIAENQAAVYASEIIHDRGECLFHPLIGVSPLYAAARSATQGVRIQNNSQTFFENLSRPAGQLTAPGTISDETAARLKAEFESRFSGANLGRLFIGGDNLHFEPITMPAEEAQLIEQLKWTGEDVCRSFLVPAYKIGLGTVPALSNISALNQEYYQQCLQRHLEGIEDLLDDGLALPSDIAAEFDTEALLRMDPKTRAETRDIEIKSAVLKPNEARRAENRPPVTGGDTVYMQQQNYSLAALAKRDAKEDPFGKSGSESAPPSTPPATTPAANDDEIPDEEADDIKAIFRRSAA